MRNSFALDCDYCLSSRLKSACTRSLTIHRIILYQVHQKIIKRGFKIPTRLKIHPEINHQDWSGSEPSARVCKIDQCLWTNSILAATTPLTSDAGPPVNSWFLLRGDGVRLRGGSVRTKVLHHYRSQLWTGWMVFDGMWSTCRFQLQKQQIRSLQQLYEKMWRGWNTSNDMWG